MNEIPLDKDEDELIHTPSNPLSSTAAEIDDLATELANGYLSYLDVNVENEEQRLDDSIQECLIQLEGVSKEWENYKRDPAQPNKIVETILAKSESLERLYEQIDSLEQYIFVANQTLDNLESALKEIESRKPSKNKIQQIIEILPKLSIQMPRFGL